MLISFAGCGDAAPAASPERAQPRVSSALPDPSEAPPERSAANALPRGLAVHDWGFVGFDALSTEAAPAVNVAPTELGAVGLATAVGFGTGSTIDVHLAPDSPSVGLTIRFGTGSGFQIVEQWPRAVGPLDGWARVSVRVGDCQPSSYPSAGDDVCQTEDGICSSSTGAARESDGTACLEGDRIATRALGYRPTIARARLPLDVRRRGTELVVSRIDASNDPIQVVRVVRGADGSVARVVRFDGPTGTRSIAIPAPSAAEEGLSEGFAASFVAGGLTTTELATIDRTLLAPLFGAGGSEEPSDALYYLLATPQVERLLPMTVEPGAESVRRFLLVRISLSPLARRRWSPDPSPTFRARTDGLPVVSGGSVDVHRRVVLDHLIDLESCAERAYRPGQLIAERVVVRYELASNGRVRSATVDGPGGSNRRVVACVESAFLSFQFPPSSAPIALGRVPISILAMPPR